MKRDRRYANNRHCEKAQPTKQSRATARVTGLPRLPYGLLAMTVILFTFYFSLFISSSAYAACASPVGTPGQIVYNDDFRMLQYCDGNDQWVKMGPSPYLPNAVTFDGTNDYLSYGSPLTGVADGKTVTASGWIRRYDNTSVNIFFAGTTQFFIQITGSGGLEVVGRNPSNTEVLRVVSNTTSLNNSTTWHHFMFSIDMVNSANNRIYLDGIAQALSYTTNTNDILDFATTSYAIGSQAGALNITDMDIADLWIDFGRYINLSLEKNRRLFIDANGMPVDLGADGSNPTGNVPDVFLSGDTANWHVNLGAGGGFTENGTLTDAATSPGDTPVLGTGTWAQVGNSFALANNDPSITSLTKDTVAYISEVDQLQTYRWDGSNWVQIGNSLSVDATDPWITALSTNTIAMINEVSNQLQTYRWDGANWSQIGSGLTIAGGTVSNPSIAALDSSTIAFVENTFDQLRTYKWSGSAWSQVGNGLGILPNADTAAIVALNNTTVALTNQAGDTIQAYTWDGTNWTLTGSSIPVGGGSVADPMLTALNDETVVFIDGLQKQMHTYQWSGSSWSRVGDIITFVSAAGPALTTLDSRTIAYVDAGYDTLRTYQNTVGCVSPNGQAGMMVYNRSSNTMQFCNGSAWVDMKPIAPPTNGLVGHWKLDETTGTSVADSSGLSLTGTMAGSMTAANDTVPGNIGTALDFDGTDDYIELGTPVALNMGSNNFTLSAWAKMPDSGGGQVVGKINSGVGRKGYAIFKNAGGQYECDTDDGTLDTSYFTAGNYEDAKWHHIVCVRDGTTLRMYIDGVAEPSYDATGLGNLDDPAAARIGNRELGNFYTGAIDDVRIYSRALSANEVTDLYYSAGGNPAGDPMNGLVGYWPMNDAVGSATAADLAGDGIAYASGGVIFDPAGGRIGGAASFDGVDDILKPTLNPALNDIATLTFTAWIYPTDWGGGTFGRIGSKENAASTGGIEIYVGSDTAQRLQVRSNRPTDGLWVSPNSSIALNTWQHVAVVYDNTSVANDPLIYINGTPATVTETSTPIGAPTTDSTLNWRIGNTNVLSRGFDGLIDDVRIYNRLLSAPEIDAIYDAGAAGKAAIDCTGPDGIEGEMLYNTTNNIMQFCDGKNWIGIGSHGDILTPASIGSGSVFVARSQYKMSGETDPSTVTLDATPVQGNLLVAIAAHRREAGGPTISGTGWTQHIAFSDHTFAETGSTSYRRGLAVWSKIAGAAEPTAITVDFGDGASRLLVQEFSVSGGTPSFDVSNYNVGPEQPLITSLTTNTTATSTTANSLVVTALMSRDSLGGGVSWTNGVANDIGTDSTISLHSGYKLETTAGTRESTASWTTSINAATGIVVFKIE